MFDTLTKIVSQEIGSKVVTNLLKGNTVDSHMSVEDLLFQLHSARSHNAFIRMVAYDNSWRLLAGLAGLVLGLCLVDSLLTGSQKSGK